MPFKYVVRYIALGLIVFVGVPAVAVMGMSVVKATGNWPRAILDALGAITLLAVPICIILWSGGPYLNQPLKAHVDVKSK